MPTLLIQLLNGFQLCHNDETVMLHQPRLHALVGYLALHQHMPHSRQRLSFLFWPDASEAKARANLRKMLFDLRRFWPEVDNALEIGSQSLRWHDTTILSVDVDAFRMLLAQSEQTANEKAQLALIKQAIALYSGDFLPDCYDDWVLSERERLSQQYATALERLIHLLEKQRDYPAALSYGQLLLNRDTLAESTYLLLMRLHMLNGDRASALRLYHSCATQLQRELGVEPSAEVVALHRRLLEMEAVPVTPLLTVAAKLPETLPLVGRQQEWATLQTAWLHAVQGKAHIILIAGEAGIGKSRLAEELLQWVGRQDYPSAYTRCYAAEGKLAYAPLTEWLRTDAIQQALPQLEEVWLVEVARLLPELLAGRPELAQPAPLTDSWQRQCFREALVRAFLTVQQPLLLVVDDLQWCDGETLEWLHYLLRQAAHKPLLLAATVRSEEAGANHPLQSLIMHLRQNDQLTEIELKALAVDETAALAAQVVGHMLDPHQAAALYRQTEGHPLFMIEVMQAWEQESQAGERAQRAPLPSKFQEVIRYRLSQPSMPSRELLDLAATMGRAFTLELVVNASDVGEDALAERLEELLQHRLIREQGDNAYDFSHDKIRESAYASLNLLRRRILHKRVAQALEKIYSANLDPVSSQLAFHYESADLLGQAISYYDRAALVAQRIFALAEEMQYLTKALELLGRIQVTSAQRQQELVLQLRLAECLNELKSVPTPDVRAAFERAQALSIELSDAHGQLLALRGQFNHYMSRAELHKAYRVAEEYNCIGSKLDQSSDGAIGCVLFHYGKWRRSTEYLAKALRHTDPHLNPSLPPTRRSNDYITHHRHQAIVLWHLGYPDQALALMEEALVTAKAILSPPEWTAVFTWSTWLHHYRRELELVAQKGEIATAYATRYGQSYWHTHAQIIMGAAQALQGDVERGIASIHEGLVARREGGARTHLPAFLAFAAEVHGYAGQLEAGLQLLDDALEEMEVTNDRFAEAEVYRLKGNLLSLHGADVQEVESFLQRALEIARQQESKSLELRASMSLARLWQKQGKCHFARDLLSAIYDWFTEGFNTLDLIEANALLEELA